MPSTMKQSLKSRCSLNNIALLHTDLLVRALNISRIFASMFSFRNAVAFMACLLVSVLVSSCNEPDILGLDLQPEDDQLGVNRLDTFQLDAYVTPEDSLVTSRVETPLFVGNMNEPLYYGSTYAGFAMQVRLGNTLTPGIFDGVSGADSIVLSFAWRTIAGDTSEVHHLSVHQLGDALSTDSVYYSTKTFTTSGVLGHKDFKPALSDSVIVDSVARSPQFRMALDSAFGTKLIQDFKNNPSDFASQAAFLTYLKGIVLVDSVDGKGSIITFEPASSFNRLTLYFGGGTGVYDFVLDNNSSRFNYFRHTYNPDLKDSIPDSRFVIQSMAGLKTRIKIPHLSELKNKLGNVSINNAQIIFKLEPGSDPDGFTPHSNLIVFGSDSAGKNTLLIDATESSLYYGGIYNASSKEYKFNISRYVQRVLTGTKDYGLYLVAGGSTSNAQRTILQGGTNVRFIITYTLVNP